MLDEFGYTTSDLFIFKSTWDYNYYNLISNEVYSNSFNLNYIDNEEIGNKNKIKNVKL
jgi:hypothetical protein